MNPTNPVVHVDDIEEQVHLTGAHWGQAFKPLTPALDALGQLPGGNRLGVNLTRVPPGRSGCPFHLHTREDEVFYVLSGTGVLRYGEALYDIRAGSCVSCPAGTGVAHQIANTGDVDLVFLAIGPNDPNEVCVYPDTGKVLVRALGTVGRLEKAPYMDGEPDRPKVFALVVERAVSASSGSDPQ